MRQVEIPEELCAQIDSLRGDMPFDTWLALAITEKSWGSRLTQGFLSGLEGGGEPPAIGDLEELWVAMVQLESGHEMFLLWRYTTPTGIAMAPVIATTAEGMEAWRQGFGMELGVMDGPPICWRHFTGGEFVEWLRAPLERDEPDQT